MFPLAHRFDFSTSPHLDAAATCRIRFHDAVAAHDHGTGREIRPFDFSHNLFNRRIRVVDKNDQTVDDFAQIVRWDIRRHTDSDTCRTIDQQVRYFRRQYGRFLKRTVIVRHEIDCFLVDILQHFTGNLGHTYFCITHSSRRITIY